jgi:hypothetical protein
MATKSVVPSKDSKVKPYSPLKPANNVTEFALTKLDDLLNWGRKCKANFYISNL